MTTRYSKVSDALVETIVSKPKLKASEAADQAGVDLEEARQFWRSLGFSATPDHTRSFTKQDVAMLRAAHAIRNRDDADPEVLLQIVRASGQALARMTAVQVVPIASEILSAMRSREYSDSEAVDHVVGASDTLLTLVEPFVSYAWRRHLVEAVLQLAASGAADVADAHELTVGFADIVGFTATSQELGNREIASTVARFEKAGYEQILECGGKFVKMIGDEVMFTSETPEVAAEISLRLLEVSEADDILPELRIGLATGPTLLREGDVYGPTVNLASRLVNIARPGTILVSEALGDHLANYEAVTLRPTRRVKLKGIGRTRPQVLRRR